jgi:hypothetical protein
VEEAGGRRREEGGQKEGGGEGVCSIRGIAIPISVHGMLVLDGSGQEPASLLLNPPSDKSLYGAGCCIAFTVFGLAMQSAFGRADL